MDVYIKDVQSDQVFFRGHHGPDSIGIVVVQPIVVVVSRCKAAANVWENATKGCIYIYKSNEKQLQQMDGINTSIPYMQTLQIQIRRRRAQRLIRANTVNLQECLVELL